VAREIMKVSSKIYKGIEYVQLSELPKDQKEKILEMFDEESFIKIMMDKTIIRKCLQYKDYEMWFDNYYRSAHLPSPARKEILVNAPMEVIFGKA
jgi:hypothetical protein